MGQTLSCLSPNDSEPTNLSKKHPGRAEAIAEYKARKNAGKPKPEQATVNLAETTESKSISVVEKPVDEKSPAEEVEKDEKTQDEDDGVEEVKEQIEAKEQIEEKVPEVEDVVELKDVENVEKDKKVEEVTDEAPKELNVEDKEITNDAPTNTTAVEPPVEEKVDIDEVQAVEKTVDLKTDVDEIKTDVDEIKTDAEEIKIDLLQEEEKPVTPSPDNIVTPLEKQELPLPEVEEIDVPTTIASEAVLKTPTLSPLINARRHIFETGDDTIPEAKKLDMDVKDPVTGDMVTLAEYRRRQSERAQGVVKEHVEKYESIDEKALKEVETRKMQEESRSKGREGSRNWTVAEPSSPSTPKSASSPMKKDPQVFTL